MDDPKRIYELLLDYCTDNLPVNRLTVGLVWTVCQTASDGTKQSSIGLSMSPGISTRLLPWAGTLTAKSICELAPWINSWDPYQSTIAMAAINCCINARPLPDSIALDSHLDNQNLAVFDYFLPQLQGKKVVVIGHYPGIETYRDHFDLTVLERNPAGIDWPDSACEFVIPGADWVFITGSSLANKTFPRLAELAVDTTTVLMGPSVPWLPQFYEFGIDYLAGVEITDAEKLYRTVEQGGGVRIFGNGLRYRIATLSPENNRAWLKNQIAACFNERNGLTARMDQWYSENQTARFPQLSDLERVNARLSRMDSSFKQLWDQQGESA
ncbi:DUF364 domain-containing protein [Methylicorpusculum sp.]|uniref:DUF364 domain-containing protein n=1 Tax=Methylicorpusculum sp. TaxID=2713644 RepID=UPI002721FEC3|nr:DUF364 domain-containing protein [Methylicorpusculum sp.]MDO8845084.1 DUF364 domain-containing protein [Methylicorpusculum sp.]